MSRVSRSAMTTRRKPSFLSFNAIIQPKKPPPMITAST